MVFMVVHLFLPLTLSLIEGKWSYCDWGIENGVDFCPSVAFLVYRR